jgi:ABC-2 type transport system ATP-binding protein
VRERVGYLPENVPLPPDARVDEYLEFRARLKAVPGHARAAARERAMTVCGLVPMRRRIIGQLSRGYRQRVGLADALIADPPVLILDEPTGGLDPGQRQEVLDHVAGLRGERTVLLSSHVLAEVEHSCSRVAIIQRGRIVAQGTKAELEANAGRRGEVEVRARGQGEPLAAALVARGLQPRREGDPDSRIVRLAEDADAARLLADLVREGVGVDSFRPLERSLQDLFLELTRAPVA